MRAARRSRKSRRIPIRLQRAALALGAAAILLSPTACAPGGGNRRSLEWIAGRAAPRFDPDGPPDELRWSIERLLSEGLTRELPDGGVTGAAADRYQVSADGLAWTFHLRSGLRFTDGHACTSADFRDALLAGLARTDHSVHAAMLAALRGARPALAGRTPSGIETPDARTLVLRLDRPDSLLPLKLSLPGISTPWRSRAPGEWSGAIGLGPYRLAHSDHGLRLSLARVGGGPGPDSVHVRFMIGVARTRALMRGGGVDLLWPVPAGLLDQPAPAGCRLERSTARPRRQLLLVMRADTPPTHSSAARHALAHGIHRSEVIATLGHAAALPGEMVPGGGPFDFPRYDASEVASWRSRADLGLSFQVSMLYDADRTGDEVARGLQGTWSRQNIYVELRGLRGGMYTRDALAGHEPLLLAEWQPLESGAEFALLSLAQAPRLAPAGAFRTGWRPAELAAWLPPGRSRKPLSSRALENRLEADLVALPLADLPWVRVVREGGRQWPFHPHFGPDFAAGAGAGSAASRAASTAREH